MSEFNDAASKELLMRAGAGDEGALDQLVEKNIGLVWSVVKRFLNRGAESEDLFQIGSIGLVKAIRNFDTSYDVCFSTYAVPMIAGEIKRFLRDDGPIKVSRSIKELYVKAKSTMEIMHRELGRDPTVSEVAARLQVEPEELAVAMDSGQLPESLYSIVNENSSAPVYLIDRIANTSEGAEHVGGSLKEELSYDTVIDQITIQSVIQSLDPEEQRIITLRYFNDMTQSRIAELMGISQVQVSRLEKKILNKMREKLS